MNRFPSELPGPLESLLGGANVLRLNENPRGVLAMVTGWQNAREFDIVDSVGRMRGTAAEQGRGILGFMSRTVLSGWLPLQFAVFSDPSQERVMTLGRPFFWLFSEMTVDGERGQRLGFAKRRFSIIRKRYETLQVTRGQQRAEISKKWAGMTGEMITGAQRFKVDFMNHDWPLVQRAVIFATALSIDFDSFERRGRDRD